MVAALACHYHTVLTKRGASVSTYYLLTAYSAFTNAGIRPETQLFSVYLRRLDGEGGSAAFRGKTEKVMKTTHIKSIFFRRIAASSTFMRFLHRNRKSICLVEQYVINYRA